MVPPPEFESYYGRQIIKTPTWKTPDVPLYLFLGGLSGASALLAEGAAVSGNDPFARSPADRLEAFRAVLRAQGVGSIVRYSGGGDVSAACGQLATGLG